MLPSAPNQIYRDILANAHRERARTFQFVFGGFLRQRRHSNPAEAR